MSVGWIPGNALTLLENGEAYFPRVFEVIAAARQEVWVETFILFDDKVGQALRQTLIDAAGRGVKVSVLVDGYGSDDLSAAFLQGMTHVGVAIHFFDLQAHIFGYRTNVFRRMHRKIVVVDGTVAFVGGINFSADHLADFGPEGKQDYAVEIRGPLVADIQHFVRGMVTKSTRRQGWQRRFTKIMPRPREGNAGHASNVAHAASVGEAATMFVIRDNDQHRHDIESHYRAAIRLAQHDIIIANAYFFPGYRFLRELRNAAKRGVCVRLILQGEPDLPIVKVAARMLYDYLNVAGVQIYEYCTRPLHGKVACVDGTWATVGSSNLDPLSLALNLEANVMIQDTTFASTLRDRLLGLIEHHCSQPEPVPKEGRKWRRLLFGIFVYHFLCRFPTWMRWLPAFEPKLQEWTPPSQEDTHGS